MLCFLFPPALLCFVKLCSASAMLCFQKNAPHGTSKVSPCIPLTLLACKIFSFALCVQRNHGMQHELQRLQKDLQDTKAALHLSSDSLQESNSTIDWVFVCHDSEQRQRVNENLHKYRAAHRTSCQLLTWGRRSGWVPAQASALGTRQHCPNQP